MNTENNKKSPVPDPELPVPGRESRKNGEDAFPWNLKRFVRKEVMHFINILTEGQPQFLITRVEFWQGHYQRNSQEIKITVDEYNRHLEQV